MSERLKKGMTIHRSEVDRAAIRKSLAQDNIDALARKLYETACSLDLDGREPDFGRNGYKIEVTYWHCLARVALEHWSIYD